MSTDLPAFVAELEALEAKASPRPWRSYKRRWGSAGVEYKDPSRLAARHWVRVYREAYDPVCLKLTHNRQFADSRLIAAMRNRLPELLALVRRLERERDNPKRLIKTESEYQSAMERLLALMSRVRVPGSDEESEFELLSLLIKAYDLSIVPPVNPDPIEAILFRMGQLNLTRKDLLPYIGSMSKVSEVLSRKRPLSITMIRKLHAGLGIPAEVLINKMTETPND
jgi:antitoxin component HigA of HigAB toxin-antitoxin module